MITIAHSFETSWAAPPTAERILDLLFARNNLLPGSYVGGDDVRAPHREKVEAAISARRPIEIVLPAFPAKSPNPEKTLGALPDFGEVLALRRLEELCLAIESVYAPGARLTICSDGRVFGDLVQVPDADIDAYGEAIDEIIRAYGLKRLATYGLEHAFPGHGGDAMRALLERHYTQSFDELHEKVRTRDDYRQLFNGIHRFLFEDQLALDPGASRNQVRNRTKRLAYDVIRRSNAWSELVEEKFPSALRLSIHPQPAVSTKIGIRLLPSDDPWRTPWHSVVLYDGNVYRLVKRKDAEAARARLVREDGKHGYFVLPEVRV